MVARLSLLLLLQAAVAVWGARQSHSAIVTGATGAVGRFITAELLASGAWDKVTTIGRSVLTSLPASYGLSVADLEASGRLVQHAVNMSEVDKFPDLFTGAATSICALGTTYSDAGSSDAFRAVDLGFVSSIARLSKQGGVNHFVLISSSNANKDSWFLYPRTKGEVESVVQSLDFERVSLFRPGLLARGDRARTMEYIASLFLSPLPAESVALAVRLDAEGARRRPACTRTLEDADIRHLAATHEL